MSYHYFVIQVETREPAEEVGHIFSEALPMAIAEGKACFDIKMHVVSSNTELKSTHEMLEALIQAQSEQ